MFARRPSSGLTNTEVSPAKMSRVISYPVSPVAGQSSSSAAIGPTRGSVLVQPDHERRVPDSLRQRQSGSPMDRRADTLHGRQRSSVVQPDSRRPDQMTGGAASPDRFRPFTEGPWSLRPPRLDDQTGILRGLSFASAESYPRAGAGPSGGARPEILHDRSGRNQWPPAASTQRGIPNQDTATRQVQGAFTQRRIPSQDRDTRQPAVAAAALEERNLEQSTTDNLMMRRILFR